MTRLLAHPAFEKIDHSYRQELKTIALERDPEMFWANLICLGQRFNQSEQAGAALAVFQEVAHCSEAGEWQPAPAMVQQAEAEMNGRRYEILLGGVTRESTRPSTLLALIAAQGVFRLTRAALWNRLQRAPRPGFLTQVLGPRTLAETGGFLAEAGVFPLVNRSFAGVLLEKNIRPADSLSEEFLSNYLLLGSLRLSGLPLRVVNRRVNLGSRSQEFLRQAGMLGGILAARAVAAETPNRLLDSLAILLQVNIAGRIGQYLATGRPGLWEHRSENRLKAPALDEALHRHFAFSGGKPRGRRTPFFSSGQLTALPKAASQPQHYAVFAAMPGMRGAAYLIPEKPGDRPLSELLKVVVHSANHLALIPADTPAGHPPKIVVEVIFSDATHGVRNGDLVDLLFKDSPVRGGIDLPKNPGAEFAAKHGGVTTQLRGLKYWLLPPNPEFLPVLPGPWALHVVTSFDSIISHTSGATLYKFWTKGPAPNPSAGLEHFEIVLTQRKALILNLIAKRGAIWVRNPAVRNMILIPEHLPIGMLPIEVNSEHWRAPEPVAAPEPEPEPSPVLPQRNLPKPSFLAGEPLPVFNDQRRRFYLFHPLAGIPLARAFAARVSAINLKNRRIVVEMLEERWLLQADPIQVLHFSGSQPFQVGEQLLLVRPFQDEAFEG